MKKNQAATFPLQDFGTMVLFYQLTQERYWVFQLWSPQTTSNKLNTVFSECDFIVSLNLNFLIKNKIISWLSI